MTYSPWEESSSASSDSQMHTMGATASTTAVTSDPSPVAAAIAASSWTRADVELVLEALMVVLLLASLAVEVSN